jgi:hypothetical protein
MKGKYVVAGLVGVAALAIASPVVAGPSLSSLVKQEVSKQISAQTAKKKKKAKRGPKGPAGPAGAAGAAGPAGAAGAGGGLLSGQVTGLPGVGFQYFVPSGKGPPVLNPDDGATLSPNNPTVARNLAVRLRTAVDNVATHVRTFELYAGVSGYAATGVKCDVKAVVDGGDGLTCQSTTTAAIAPHSLMVMTEVGTGNPPVSDAHFGFALTAP